MSKERHGGVIGWIDSVIDSYSHNRPFGHLRLKLTWNRISRIVSYTKSSL
jgi:hypothetical protein